MKYELIKRHRLTVKFWNFNSVCGSSYQDFDAEPTDDQAVAFIEIATKTFTMNFRKTLHSEIFFDIKTIPGE